ncbi:MAG: tRNA lysidine(34) synthetase TilS, partial [Verrucomicrobiota bacterium]
MHGKDSQLVRKIHKNIREKRLADQGARIVVGVSGGADSMALLYIMEELAEKLNLELIVAHLNHHIRGKEADKDEAFVFEAARNMGLQFVAGSSYVRRIASRRSISLEMAARKARYRFLGKTVRTTDSSCAALAHTADDQVENLILKLSRGSGLRGLSGMDWKSLPAGFPVIRPLLNVYKKELIGFLRRRDMGWREDASNKDLKIMRNAVRHEIIPTLESRLNPSFKETVRRNMDILREENNWLRDLASQLLRRCTGAPEKTGRPPLNIQELKKLSPAELRRVIHLWIVRAKIADESPDCATVARIEKLVGSKKGTGTVPLGNGCRIKRVYDTLKIENCTGKNSIVSSRGRSWAVTIFIPGRTLLPCTRLKITARKETGLSLDKSGNIGCPPLSATISLEKLGNRKLTARTWRKGDRISPTGMNGSKKVQDIFVDNKVPPEQRKTIPLVVCENELIWLPGYSVARNWT